jgi:hypothetical protein
VSVVVSPNANPAAIAAVEEILKEVYVTDVLESQLYEDMVLWDWIEEVTEYTNSDGLSASVPVKTGRSGGVGSRAIGQRLQPADHQKPSKLQFNYTNHYAQVEIFGPVVARMLTDRQACVREIDFEVTNILDDLKHMLCRQLHGDGGGNVLVSGLPALGAASTTIPIGAANFPVLERGWLYEGMLIDIGTSANPQLDAGGLRIMSIDDDESAPTITVDNACTVTVGSGISLHGNRTAGAVSNEMNGLSNIISDDEPLGGKDPSTDTWHKSVVLDNGGTGRALSVDLMLSALRKLRQRGSYPDIAHTDLVQEQAYYQELQGQVRFMGDKDLTAGNTEGLAFAKLKVLGDPEAVPGKMRFLKKKALQMYSAGPIAWKTGTSGNVLEWKQDYDAFVGMAATYRQLGTNRRRSFASLEDLL